MNAPQPHSGAQGLLSRHALDGQATNGRTACTSKQDGSRQQSVSMNKMLHNVVTPFQYECSYSISPLRRSGRFLKYTNGSNNETDRIVMPSATTIAQTDNETKNADSMVHDMETSSTYETSSYFPVVLHRMLHFVAKSDPTFMNWSLGGTGFVIDYDNDKTEMESIIKPFFSRKYSKFL